MSRLTTAILLFACLTASAAAVEPMRIGANFWDVSWGGEPNDPFVHGHQNVHGDNPWKPEFLAEIELYSVFRFMDWGKTNNAVDAHSGKTKWKDRTQRSDRLQRPMAYEWMIDLCNRTSTDMWVCLPHFADEEYMTRLACLIRDQLDPSLNCYVEWSNETWNGIFRQATYCNDGGQKLDLPPGTRWEDNLWYRGQMFHAKQTFETFHHFDRAFADQRHRLVKVIGGTTVHAFAETHIWALDQPFLNPHGVKADAYAIAPYFGNGLDGNDPEIVALAKQAIRDRIEKTHRVIQVVDDAGLQFLTYEAGQHLKQNSDVFCANPAVYDVYRDYLAQLEPHFELFMQYTHNGSHSSGNSWGAKQFIGEPIEAAHKYRALLDYATEHGQFDD